ncbi:carboxypeptidase-like regulatory domain-containing protein [Mariniluteicoccus endophyticus]
MIASVAALAVAAPLAIGVGVAYADISSDTKRFCTVPSTDRIGCTISIPIGQLNDGVDEGRQVKAMLHGAPNAKIDFAVFHADRTKTPMRITRVSQPTAVALDGRGDATATITIDKLKAPMTGGNEDFFVAPADTTDPAKVPGTNRGKVEQFRVNSARAKFVGLSAKPRSGDRFLPGEQIGYKLEAGLAGDKYVVQLKRDGKWQKVNDPKAAQYAAISPTTRTATVWWTMPPLPAGSYDVRISNAAAPDAPVWSDKFEVSAGSSVPQPTTVPPATRTAKPSGSASPSATAKPTPPANPTKTPTRTAKPTTTAKQSGSATPKPSTTAAPRATTSPTVTTPPPTDTPTKIDMRAASMLVNEAGDNTPVYTLNGDEMHTFGKLADEHGPIANATVVLRDVTGGASRELGRATTDETGKFDITVTLPAGWRTNRDFRVQLAYDGSNTHKPISLVKHPLDHNATQNGGETGDPTEGRPDAKGQSYTPSEKDEKGGLASTGR